MDDERIQRTQGRPAGQPVERPLQLHAPLPRVRSVRREGPPNGRVEFVLLGAVALPVSALVCLCGPWPPLLAAAAVPALLTAVRTAKVAAVESESWGSDTLGLLVALLESGGATAAAGLLALCVVLLTTPFAIAAEILGSGVLALVQQLAAGFGSAAAFVWVYWMAWPRDLHRPPPPDPDN